VTQRLNLSDSDAVTVVDAGQAFVLERVADKLHILGEDGESLSVIDLSTAVSGAPSQNPHGVVVVPGSAPRSAYVPLYASNHMALVDLEAGSVTNTVDFSGYQDSADTDGGSEPDYAWFDSARNRVWFTLARIDISSIVAPDYQLACTSKGLLMAIDATSGEIVDLNGAAPGAGFELTNVAPTSVHYAVETDTLYLLSSGCFEDKGSGLTRRSHGVEAIKLDSMTSSVVLSPPADAFYARLLWTPSGALIQSFVGFTEQWHRWNPTETLLGELVAFMPSSVAHDDQGNIYGLEEDSSGGGTKITLVQVAADTGARSVIAEDPFTSGLPFISGSAYRP